MASWTIMLVETLECEGRPDHSMWVQITTIPCSDQPRLAIWNQMWLDSLSLSTKSDSHANPLSRLSSNRSFMAVSKVDLTSCVLATFVNLLAQTSFASERAILKVSKCIFEVAVNERVVYQGKQRCANEEKEIALEVPSDKAIYVKTKNSEYYANGGIWAVQEGAYWMPVISGRAYKLEFDFVSLAETKNEDFQYCATAFEEPVSGQLGGFTAWWVTSYAKSFGPYRTGEFRRLGGAKDINEFIFSRPEKKLIRVPYQSMLRGTYSFVVAPSGKVKLRFSEVDNCMGEQKSNAIGSVRGSMRRALKALWVQSAEPRDGRR